MNDVQHPVAKAASAVIASLVTETPLVTDWGSTATTTAQVLAGVYTACLLFEWVWKKIIKPIAVRHGWIRGKPHPFLDTTRPADL